MTTTATYKGNTLTTVDNATKTLLTSGKYLEDNITLTDVTQGGGGGTLKMGVIRPDAELLNTWSEDALVVEDLGLTLPAYSTSATTLRATANIESYTGTPVDYAYYVLQRLLTIPIYDTTEVIKGRQEYSYGSYPYEYVYTPTGVYKPLDKSKSYGQYSQIAALGSVARLGYWSATTTFNLFTSASYGCYQTAQAPAIASNKTITVKKPTIAVRGHSTYMPQAVYEHLTDIRIQWVQELWRVPREPNVIEGWQHTSVDRHMIECVLSDTHKLT